MKGKERVVKKKENIAPKVTALEVTLPNRTITTSNTEIMVTWEQTIFYLTSMLFLSQIIL